MREKDIAGITWGPDTATGKSYNLALLEWSKHELELNETQLRVGNTMAKHNQAVQQTEQSLANAFSGAASGGRYA